MISMNQSRHIENQMVRVLMRQEKTMKVICNHVTDPRIVLKPNAGSDRSWVWNAFDYAEGQLEETTFALRCGNSDSANEFKEVSASVVSPFFSISSSSRLLNDACELEVRTLFSTHTRPAYMRAKLAYRSIGLW